MDDAPPRRFQLSIRTVMMVCAVFALLCAPVAWVARERQQMLRLQRQILAAREVALASAIREETTRRCLASKAASTTIQELQRENAELRRQLEQLARELAVLREEPRKAEPAPP